MICATVSAMVLMSGGLALWKPVPKVAVRAVNFKRELMAPDRAVFKTQLRAAASWHMNATVRFDSTGNHFVFLGVYQMAPTIYHSGVIVCAKSGFQESDEEALVQKIACHSDTEIPESDGWWSCW